MFNLTKTVGQLLGKTVSATYFSIRHPFKFAPRNLVQIFRDLREGIDDGLQNYNNAVRVVRMTRVPNHESQPQATTGQS